MHKLKIKLINLRLEYKKILVDKIEMHFNLRIINEI